jgi:phospholipase C
VPNGTGEPGGCTRDLVHRFHQEPYQIDGGRMDRYTVGSDAVGLTQGYYDTRSLPLLKFLTSDKHAPRYVIADHFFQSAFGGSFLNHQWLIAAQRPKFEGSAPQDGSANDLHSIVGTDGHPNNTYPLHSGPVWPAPGGVKDGPLTEAADRATGKCAPPASAPTPPPGTVCGDFAVNTIQPTFQPFQPGTPPARQLPPSHNTNIGDLLSAKGISQPFNYYQGYGPTQPGRSHLKDEQDFLADLRAGDLPAVSFLKPVGEENEHPGYTNSDPPWTTPPTTPCRSFRPSRTASGCAPSPAATRPTTASPTPCAAGSRASDEPPSAGAAILTVAAPALGAIIDAARYVTGSTVVLDAGLLTH